MNMKSIGWKFLTVVSVLVFSSASWARVIGDFEGQLDPGWRNWSEGTVTLSFTSEGATLNNYAIKAEIDGSGYRQFLVFDVNTVGWSAIVEAERLAMSLRFDPALFRPATSAFHWSQINLVLNSPRGGWLPIGLGSGRPDYDDTNTDYPGGWDTQNWPTAMTRNVRWDLTAAKQAIGPEGPGAWCELVLILNSDTFFTSTGIIVDKVELVRSAPPPPPPLLGDTNGDGVVDLADYNNVVNNLGASGSNQLGDTNNDNVVDLADYNNVVNNLGATRKAGLAVPEPVSLVLLIGTGLLLRPQRRP